LPIFFRKKYKYKLYLEKKASYITLLHGKTTHKLLVKLNPTVNFINILLMRFSYESLFGSFFSSYVFGTKMRFRTKKHVRKMLVKLTPRRPIFVPIFLTKFTNFVCDKVECNCWKNRPKEEQFVTQNHKLSWVATVVFN